MNVSKRFLTIFTLLIPAAVFADVKPAGIFTDGTVLQQGESVRIWGTADVGEEVVVEFAEQKIPTKADADGKWMVTFKPMPASSTPREMVFYSNGKRQIALGNVVVGEVWLAGGQSNMATTMQNYKKTTQADMDNANDPLLRMVTIPRLEYEGQNGKRPEWRDTNPKTVGGFSATAYYFAKNLRTKLNVPVGIISCSVGATPAEAWMSRKTLASTPDLKRILDVFDTNVREKYGDLSEYLRLAEEREGAFAEWQKKQRSGEKPLPPFPPEVMGPRNYKRPCGLHETMLSQTIPCTLRGVIWYQGENNAGAHAGLHYRTVFSALIKEWRAEFMNPNMPFLFVQLATFGPLKDSSVDWPELRDAQQWTEDNVENTGMVVLTDGGEIDNIHPHSKDKAGQRLSLLARHMVYGEKDLVCRGPRVDKATPQENQIALVFKNVGSGLVLKDAKTTPFEICGKDGKYVPAQAKLAGGKIIVSAAGVTQPQYLRYGWRKWFEPTLFNREGLPASPFKTDDFEAESKGRFYLDNL